MSNLEEPKIMVNGIDLTTVFRDASIKIGDGLRRHFGEARTALSDLEALRSALDRKLKELEGIDRLGNFEIQQLMSAFNEAQTLASSVHKKANETMNCIIRKIS